MIEEKVESMSQQVWNHLRDPKVQVVKVWGWNAVGKMWVTERVAATAKYHTGDFSGVVRVRCSKQNYSPEYEIRTKIQEELQLSNLPDFEDGYSWARLFRDRFKLKAFVVIVDNLRRVFNWERLGIPMRASGRESTLEYKIIKLVFTTSFPGVTPDNSVKVIESFGSLGDEAALELVCHEAHSSAEITAVEFLSYLETRLAYDVEGNHTYPLPDSSLKEEAEEININANRSIGIGISGGTTIKCFLYFTLFLTTLSEGYPIDYWRSEGLFFAADCDSGLEENTMKSALRVNALISDLGYRIMLRLMVYTPFVDIITTSEIFPSDREKLASLVSSSQSLIQQQGRYLVQHSLKLEQVVMDEWTQDLSRISFANNHIKTILLPRSSNVTDFPRLSTLLLQDNPSLQEIPEEVFHCMPNLRVLDLSRTAIQMLPTSLSCLKNLRMLCLQECQHLKTLEMAGLDVLEVLNLRESPLKELTTASWQHMHNLKHLNYEKGLQNLEYLQLSVNNTAFLNNFYKHDFPVPPPPKKCSIFVIPSDEKEKEKDQRKRASLRDSRFQRSRFPYADTNANTCTRPTHSLSAISDRTYYKYNRCIDILGGHDTWGLYGLISILRPNFLSLHNFQNAHQGIRCPNSGDLKSCYVQSCNDMAFVFHSDISSSKIKTGLEILWISRLTRAKALFKAVQTSFDQRSFMALASIYIEYCPNLHVLFPMAVELPCLEVMEIRFCGSLEKVFEEDDVTIGDQPLLPKLKRLTLFELPNLTTICHSGCLHSLQRMEVRGCWRLRKVPFPLPSDSSQSEAAATTANKVEVRSEIKWWKNLSGDNIGGHIEFKTSSPSATQRRIPRRWGWISSRR